MYNINKDKGAIMSKLIGVLGLILMAVACIAAGYYLPSSIALPIALVLAVASTAIARAQKRHKEVSQGKPDKDIV